MEESLVGELLWRLTVFKRDVLELPVRIGTERPFAVEGDTLTQRS